MRIAVDLPAPLTPRMPTTSPRPTSKLTSSSATRSPNRRVRWETWITGRGRVARVLQALQTNAVARSRDERARTANSLAFRARGDDGLRRRCVSRADAGVGSAGRPDLADLTFRRVPVVGVPGQPPCHAADGARVAPARFETAALRGARACARALPLGVHAENAARPALVVEPRGARGSARRGLRACEGIRDARQGCPEAFRQGAMTTRIRWQYSEESQRRRGASGRA